MRGKLFYYLPMGPPGTKGILLSNKVYLVGEKATTINIFFNSFKKKKPLHEIRKSLEDGSL